MCPPDGGCGRLGPGEEVALLLVPAALGTHLAPAAGTSAPSNGKHVNKSGHCQL